MFDEREWTITEKDVHSYALASGDHNPIHTNAEAAKKAGLPGCIVHGMLVMALGARAVREWQPDPIRSLDARFQAMTYPNELLRIKGSWTNEEEGIGIVQIENGKGDIKMKGTFSVKRNAL